jgi:MFS family permease
MDGRAEGKTKQITLEHLEKVDSNDPQHRNVVGGDANDLHGYWASQRLIGSLFGAILLANSIYIGVIMPTNVVSIINADVGPSANVYLITFVSQLFTGVLHLFFARISDVVGRRYFLIAGQLFGVVGSIICARAQSVNTLIAGSAFVGVGGAAGLLYPVIIHELIPNRHRPWGQAGVTLGVRLWTSKSIRSRYILTLLLL